MAFKVRCELDQTAETMVWYVNEKIAHQVALPSEELFPAMSGPRSEKEFIVLASLKVGFARVLNLKHVARIRHTYFLVCGRSRRVSVAKRRDLGGQEDCTRHLRDGPEQSFGSGSC